ncbi:putative F-box domain, leucine-rich repeat domain, L domain-containing protein [Medicago truncatula]|uniref:F-box/RNI/FBD-like domain protein n=1 Tax=Medicago truncatula TaxID=3880 RepID=G7LGM5_MEDTR|nr:F-box protein At4g27050 [Medicago truncatula]AET01505.1 F-box/RNI/FBD-like domain protein [Medicago truncatula]AFK48375.1 unknown [Medicago truncatula]RHN39134.1 putative F-box domain, leucine-rich repeat domain, L domain-containing protein [Medicago truncatula]
MAEDSKLEEDRISNLPDGLLNQILSLLPIKDAVATGRLSRRWRHLWKHLSVLNFSLSHFKIYEECDGTEDPTEEFRSFALLVNGVLALLRNPRAIRKFHLHCAHSHLDDKFRAYSVDTWVRSVIGPHLEELNLVLYSKEYKSAFKLPQTLFTSANLISLS